jgi:hypothetical protein
MNWEETLKKDTINLSDYKKSNKLDIITRKRKSTYFCCEIPQTKREMPPPGKMKNMFHFEENLSKLCAKGAIQHLMNMLRFLTKDMNIFWELATSNLFTLMESLNESNVPKAVKKTNLGTDLIQKCLWILRKKSTFRPQKTEHQLFSVFEVLIDCAFRNKISHVDFS